MENILLSYFIRNDELRDTCDFSDLILTEGPGIYEVIRIIDGKPLFLAEHINRFFKSAAHEGYSIGYSQDEIKARIKLLITQNRMTFGNVRFQMVIHPELGNLFLAWAISFYYPNKQDLKNGVQVVSVNASRENPHSKRTNLPVRLLAERMIEEKHVAEVLMITETGLVTEGSRSNIFFVSGNDLITPVSALVLQGVTRDKIICLAKSNNIKVIEKNIRHSQLGAFDACFLSSTSKGVLPVNHLDDYEFKVTNPITQKISLLYHKLVFDHLKDFKW